MRPYPRKVIAIVVLLLFIGLPVAVFFFGGDGQSFERACNSRCAPRFSRVVPDPAYPSPATGKPVPLVCQCY